MIINNISDFFYIQKLENIKKKSNNLYVLREDLIPFSFGGNKVRKNAKYFDYILSNGYNYIISSGRKTSNHIRVLANFCNYYNLKGSIIVYEDEKLSSVNYHIIQNSNLEIIDCYKCDAEKLINNIYDEKLNESLAPLIIPSGASGEIGLESYIEVYEKIKLYENTNNINFDYIYLASGTGSTQAGLIIGGLIDNQKNPIIVGVSIARESEKSISIIREKINRYFKFKELSNIHKDFDINFNDGYSLGGYRKGRKEIQSYSKYLYLQTGIPFDNIYTGKAFRGLLMDIEIKNISNCNILFIHTGGTPLFFDQYIDSVNLL